MRQPAVGVRLRIFLERRVSCQGVRLNPVWPVVLAACTRKFRTNAAAAVCFLGVAEPRLLGPKNIVVWRKLRWNTGRPQEFLGTTLSLRPPIFSFAESVLMQADHCTYPSWGLGK